ncbi:MAG: hypothetical protein EU551_01055 [Promethearchaeota archaeon]|nr:MAG: hypothetical protein EU551_01055 [Candidatus Lokiarchaeota archaeon]
MSLSVAEWTILLITISFGVLVVLIIIQSIIHKRQAWGFLTSLVFGLLAGLVAIINELVFSGYGIIQDFFQSLHLNLYGFHFFFFFIFFERLLSKKLNSIRLSIMVGLIILQTIGLWLVFYYRINSLPTDIAWVLADIGYWTPALFTYFGLGVPIYIMTYIYTKEIKPIILCIALIFVSIGFIISLLNDLYFILGVFDISIPTPDIIGELSTIGNIFPFIGIIMFAATYLSQIDYIYRIPNDTYALMVLTISGMPIHAVHLKTRKKVTVENVLLSGMISAINSVFKEVFKRETSIKNISSKGIDILLESGDKILALVITDKVSYFLDKGLKRYVRKFEKEFSRELEEGARDLVVYDRATKLLKSIFPFFIVDEEKTFD